MSTVFSITTATIRIVLDHQRHGVASFTVQNTTNRRVVGAGRPLPEAGAAASWLTGVGEPERDFGPAEAQAYQVAIDVPGAVAAGTYGFHLEMVDLANPDDNSSEGPTVTFLVADAPPPQRCPPGGYAAATAGALVLGFAVAVITLAFGSTWAIYFGLLAGEAAGAAVALRWRGYPGVLLTGGALLAVQALWSLPIFLGLASAGGWLVFATFACFPPPLVARGVALWRLGTFQWPWCRWTRAGSATGSTKEVGVT